MSRHYLNLGDTCRDCDRTLDAFGQCMYCDTYGTPAEQAQERAEAAAALPTEPCSTCGQPACPSTGLCERCRESYDAEMDSSRAHWLGEAL